MDSIELLYSVSILVNSSHGFMIVKKVLRCPRAFVYAVSASASLSEI